MRPLANVNSLIAVRITNTRVSDLTPLAKLSNLTQLTISNFARQGRQAVVKLKSMKLLVLSSTQISVDDVELLRLALSNCSIAYIR